MIGLHAFPQASLLSLKTSFAVSSDDFGLPLSRGAMRDRARRSPSSQSPAMDVSDPQTCENLRRLRSTAFWELQQSVGQGGEGFIGSMREHEHMRSSSLQAGERNSSAQRHSYQSHPDTSGDEDDDIQIYAGETSTQHVFQTLDVPMDTEYHRYHDQNNWTHHPSKSTFPQSPSARSNTIFASLPSQEVAAVGALASASSNLGVTGNWAANFSGPPSNPHSAPLGSGYHPLRSTSFDGSEKVIEALALAMANGAGGLNDYAALRQHSVDEDPACHDAGELWR